MKLTTKSEYSVLALIHIARNQTRGYVRIEDICAAYGMPKKYLEQLLIMLKQNGLVRTRRGVGGGYVLAVPPGEITLARVIRLMDGALAPVESVSTHFFSHTPLEQERKVTRLFKDIRDYIAQRMEHTTLADVI
ncbi:Rrf2 family transcriptional regulator [bacterium]|nr:Rrf2 family transcriptional regulator [bacterium]